MTSVRTDGLVVFSAADMIHHGGEYKNYWGLYWTCHKCGNSWAQYVRECRCETCKENDLEH